MMKKFLFAVLAALLLISGGTANAKFLQPDWFDPTLPGVGTNRYAYSANDPINRRDPFGNNWEPDGTNYGVDTDGDDVPDAFDYSGMGVGGVTDANNGQVVIEGQFASGSKYAGHSENRNGWTRDWAEDRSNLTDTQSAQLTQEINQQTNQLFFSAYTGMAAIGIEVLTGPFPTSGLVTGGPRLLGSSIATQSTSTAARSLSAAANPVFQTTKEAAQVAKSLGFQKVKPGNSPVKNSHGQAVFTDGKTWISRDVDGHLGGAWKAFDRSGNRIGTYNRDLSVRIGN